MISKSADPSCPTELVISDPQNLEDKQKVCLGPGQPAQQENIISSSNNVAIAARMVSWGREVLVEYKGVVDIQAAGNCSEGWVELKNKCFLVVRQEKSWLVRDFEREKIVSYGQYFQDAEQFCMELGGTLASVGSDEENEKLAKIISAR